METVQSARTKKSQKILKFKIQIFILLTIILFVGFSVNINAYADVAVPPGVILMDYFKWDVPHPTLDRGIRKPTAKFRIETSTTTLREGDAGAKINVLVGEKIKIIDESTVGDGTVLDLWDFQYHSNETTFSQALKNKPDREIIIDTGGLWGFYLNVRDNMSIQSDGNYGNFSENGIHQAIDKRKEQSHGEWWYWYFNKIVVNGVYGRTEIKHIDIDTGSEIGQGENNSNLIAGTYVYSKKDIANYEFVRSAMGYSPDELMASVNKNENIGTRQAVLSGNNRTAFINFYYRKEVDNEPPPETPGYSGDIGITFSPNSTQEIGGNTKDGNSYWVNKDINVKVTATGDVKVNYSAKRNYEYTYKIEKEDSNENDGTIDFEIKNGTGFAYWERIQTLVPIKLKIGGTAGVNTIIDNGGNVTISKEGMNMQLTAEITEWREQSAIWAIGNPSHVLPEGEIISINWIDEDPPKAPKPMETFFARSGFYSLDKTPPVIKINYNPIKNKWTNVNFNVTVSANDKSGQGAAGVSGFNNSYFDITNISYTGNHAFMGKKNIPHNYSGSYENIQNVTINKDGVYKIITSIEDLAGNKGEVYINGSKVSTSGNWIEGDLPLDKTKPESARFTVINNGYVAPKTITNVSPKSSNYVVNKEAPGFEYTADKDNNKIVVHIDDNISGTGSNATYESDTNGTRLQFAWSKDYRTLTEGGWINYDSKYISSNAILKEHITPTWSPPDYGGNLGRTSIYFDPHLGLNFYGQLLEGQWYLHIRQQDRAGNITQTVSPPIFFNKIKNLRVVLAHDYLWRDIFEQGNGTPSNVQIQGIRAKDMPLYKNRFGHYIGMGYRVTFKFDTVGFEEKGDTIQIGIKYHAIDNKNNLYRDVDIYLPNKNGDYVEISDINNPKWDSELEYYYNLLKVITIKADSSNKGVYESYNELDNMQKNRQTKDLSKSKYNTYEHFTFLPHTAKIVRRGYPLDLFRGENMFTNKLLVTFDVIGKKGHNQLVDLDYTGKEDQWGVIDKWRNKPAGDYNIYGKNLPSRADLIGKGINAGEIFYYDLTRSVLDDLKLNRRW